MNVKYKRLSGFVVLFIVMSLGLGMYHLQAYDNSVLEIYAIQQDAYVQLVLDQINLQEGRSDEEIVTEILGSLDASNKKYWTLSKEQAMLFVKDVVETNRYKGFLAESYYISDSASEFLEGLSVNEVVHKTIEIEEERYVASGVAFLYGGNEYRICLLTNRDVILADNHFLSAKISLFIIMACVLTVLLIITLVLSSVIGRMASEEEGMTERIAAQNRTIDMLGERMKSLDTYQTRWNLFNETVLETFLKKLNERKSFPVTMVWIRTCNQQIKQELLSQAQILLDKKVLRFALEAEMEMLLVFVQYDKETALDAFARLRHKSGDVILLDAVECREQDTDLWDTYRKMREQEK